MTEEKPKTDDLTRIIVLVYGMMESGGPFWVYVAVKPSKYQGFMTAQKEGKLDLHAFDQWGEIIISGEGRMPPDEVTLKVADMYQTDPSTLLNRTDPVEDAQKLAATVQEKLDAKKNK
jgi:hypothetical protein